MTDKYRGWTISYDPPPIPIRSFDWQAYGPNYDAWTDDGDWTDNGEKAAAGTRDELIAEIDAWFEENCFPERDQPPPQEREKL